MKKLIVGMVLLVAAVCGGVMAADPDVTSREGWRVLVSTNTITTNTWFTPTHAGQLLTGQLGGSNFVWVAAYASTNAWVTIANKPTP